MTRLAPPPKSASPKTWQRQRKKLQDNGYRQTDLTLSIQVFGRIVELAARTYAIAGSFFWMAAARTYEDYDGTTIYLNPPLKACNDQQNVKIVELICKHTVDISALNAKSPCK